MAPPHTRGHPWIFPLVADGQLSGADRLSPAIWTALVFERGPIAAEAPNGIEAT